MDYEIPLLMLNISVVKPEGFCYVRKQNHPFPKIFQTIYHFISLAQFFSISCLSLKHPSSRKQKLGCCVKNAFIKIYRFKLLIYGVTLANALIF